MGDGRDTMLDEVHLDEDDVGWHCKALGSNEGTVLDVDMD